MNKFLWLLMMAVVGFCSSASAEKEVQLMASISPPYSDNKLPEQGLALQLVKQVFSDTEYKANITIENWSQALEGANLGVYGGLATAWYSDERARTLEFSQPYLSSKLILIKARSNINDYSALQDLAGHRIGVIPDYAYGIDFDAIPDVVLVQENHVVQNLLNLLDGSVDFVVGDQRSLMHQINEFLRGRKGELAVTRISLPQVQRHVALSRDLPDYKEVLEQFNKSLAAIRKDGSLDTIVKKWDDALGTL